MKKITITLLATILVVSTLKAQNIVEIRYDYDSLSNVNSNACFGKLLPISSKESLINLGGAMLGIVNNTSGQIQKKLNDSILREKLNGIIDKSYPDLYTQYTDREILMLPTCQRLRFIYNGLFQVTPDEVYACGVTCLVKNNDTSGMDVIKCIIYFNKDLEVLNFYRRDRFYPHFITLDKGGFISENKCYIKTGLPEKEHNYDFVSFELVNHEFRYIGKIALDTIDLRKNYSSERFYSAFKRNGDYWIYDEVSLFRTKEIGEKGKQVNLNLKKNEMLAYLESVGMEKFLGLRLEMNDEGEALMGTIFQSDERFYKVDDIKRYDLVRFAINSVRTFDNTMYILLFDMQKKKMLLEKRKIK